MPHLRSLLADASQRLADAGVPSPDHDARELAAFALDVDRIPVGEVEVGPDQARRFEALLARREAREPLQHILGSSVFRYVTLQVRAGVFVPRPETEVVAQVAIDEAEAMAATGRRPLVVDLCCGTGAIALSVATEVPTAVVHAVDTSLDAVQLATINADASHAANVTVGHGDVTDPGVLAHLDGSVDVLVSNPPYIPAGAIPIDPEVRDYDPPSALFGGGEDGLDVPRAVVAAAVRLLRPGGLFVMEHADVQGAPTRELALRTGEFESIETRADLTGRDRMLVARRR
ncbi:peptide chain release factor N(5)-glutamine methyltransferase [Demequina lutea]|uniref:Release factor glutamine methyltransferase n=1 Tax=Demequina lutea TaxID=431489 RepID=A0A7Y9ZB78_9MICO|nr:peptide chain release factor N(5)-glutamine methyltransferase [Demequina lutea]NYI42154.1 release factor glutamine methyltransferase [Demequina lutea]